MCENYYNAIKNSNLSGPLISGMVIFNTLIRSISGITRKAMPWNWKLPQNYLAKNKGSITIENVVYTSLMNRLLSAMIKHLNNLSLL